MEDATPMFRQYLDIKKQYPGTLLMFRLGDFYEMFNEDAIIGARELQITLTARQKDSKNPIPMCGVPHHAASNYIAKLVRKGYRVAICEQAEPASKGSKLVRREVVRVITPGTAIEPQLLENKESYYLASICNSGDFLGLAFIELSTGELLVTELAGNDRFRRLDELLGLYSPREVVVPRSSNDKLASILDGSGAGPLTFNENTGGRSDVLGEQAFALTAIEDDDFELSSGKEFLCSHFKTNTLSGFGLDGKDVAIRAAAACLRYVHFTQKAAADHVVEIQYFEPADCLVLDQLTLRNLDILQPRIEGSKQTLLHVIDESVTGMGGRLIRSWLLRPSLRRSEIETRLTAVDELCDSFLRDKIRFLLRQVADLERLVGRLNLGSITARELNALASTLEQTPLLVSEICDARSLLLQVLSENIHELPDVRCLIASAIVPEPPANLSDGGTIREGFNLELDELRSVAGDVKRLIADLEEKERERTGIANLKIRFNNVFGYYIEVTKANASRVPDDYHRRQTLANAERFTTPQLKEWEDRVLGAESRIGELEGELFLQIREKVKQETHRLQTTARALATLDALAGLAETASKRNYVRPSIHDGDEIEIKNGRHPIVEGFINEGSFIPNDIYMNNSTDRLLIVTGANMGGKSTVLRQAALIQILAQIGSFVPASSARLPIVDRVWTRVGASDDLASGRSTFMVEMTETAAILHNSTPRSLILLDEIGRGTSTFDGLSIAWAVAEYLHDSPKHSAKTIFATHYHELTELAECLPGAKNYQMTATERDGEVVFLHKLEKGKATRSYGLAVARLAGLPRAVLQRAEEVLERLERYELSIFSQEGVTGTKAAAAKAQFAQHTLFEIGNEAVLNELRDFDADAHSTAEIKEFLAGIKRKIV